VARAGNRCVASDLLRGRAVPPADRADLAAAASWSQARETLAAELAVSLAVAAGASLAEPAGIEPAGIPAAAGDSGEGPVAAAMAYAGEDAVRFWLARQRPKGGTAPDQRELARQALDNPAYAVRYAHAAAAAVLRWAAALGTRPADPQEFRPRLLAEPGELALLDALSWLPERVAMAARRGRPDEFAGYLEGLATRTIDTMSTTEPTSEMLWLALAARTALRAGLDLLGIAAPDRILGVLGIRRIRRG